MPKLPQVIRAIGLVLAGFVVTLVVWPCAPPDYVLLSLLWEVGREEVMRVTSPDGIVDAVLIETNPGAMSSYGYLLYLVPKGRAVGKNDFPLFDAKHLRYDRYYWERPHQFIVEYKLAHVFHFTNVWRLPEGNGGDYFVELRLKPLTPGPHYLNEEGKLRLQ